MMRRTAKVHIGVVLLTAMATLSPAAAHEFWIAPSSYAVGAGATVSAELKVGQHFEGSSRSYLPAKFDWFRITNGGAEADVESRIGARPAMGERDLDPGLNVITHVTKPERLTWQEFGKFESFVTAHGLDRMVERHRERGLPEEGFVERYRRNAKSLVQVGPAAGEDAAVGMTYELVAEANPYALQGDTVPVRLLWEGEPEAGAQLHVFREGDGENFARVLTGADGRAEIPVARGETYLVNAVHLVEREGRADEDHAVWESYWASLTFGVPQ